MPQEMRPFGGTGKTVSAAQTQRTPLQRNRQDHLSSRLRASLSSATKGTGTFDELLATTCSTMRCDTRTETPRTLPRPVEREETNVKTPRLQCTSSHTKTVEKPLVLFRQYRCQRAPAGSVLTYADSDWAGDADRFSTSGTASWLRGKLGWYPIIASSGKMSYEKLIF